MSIASSTRRKTNEHREKLARRKRAKAKGTQPARDPKYLAWIRTLPCVCCKLITFRNFTPQKWPNEAAHVGDRGLRQKCSDYETLPLCVWHHRESLLSHHVLGKKFWAQWKLDKEKLVLAYKASYEEQGE